MKGSKFIFSACTKPSDLTNFVRYLQKLLEDAKANQKVPQRQQEQIEPSPGTKRPADVAFSPPAEVSTRQPGREFERVFRSYCHVDREK